MGVVWMNMIAEVKKIEQEARALEKQYEEKIVDMEKNTDSRIAEMKRNIEADLQAFQAEQDTLKNNKLEAMKEVLDSEESTEKAKLIDDYKERFAELVDIVVEEVIKQYGNS